MPKPSTYPTLFDEAKQISITNLKEWRYFNSGQLGRGTITWSSNRDKTGSISIFINTVSEKPYIELDYIYNDKPRNYKVLLVSIPSNLGNGIIWYFLCPQTNKCCRNLYLIDGYFLHREAFRGCMYECQTRSKTWRQWDKNYGSYFDLDRCYEELNRKHFKKYYKGIPTKKYQKLKSQIDQGSRIDDWEIERFLLS